MFAVFIQLFVGFVSSRHIVCMLPKATSAGKLKGIHSRQPSNVIHSLKETQKLTGLPIQKIIAESVIIAEPILRQARLGSKVEDAE